RAHGLLFFFSGGRRHTRVSRDWSSDVCSSDLGSMGAFTAGLVWAAWRQAHAAPAPSDTDAADTLPFSDRPEQQRFYQQLLAGLEIGRASCRGRVVNPGGAASWRMECERWTRQT